MEKIDVKELLLMYGHWLALAVSGLVVLGALALSGDPGMEEQLQEIEEWLQTVDQKPAVALSKEVLDVVPESHEKLRAQWELMSDFPKLVPDAPADFAPWEGLLKGNFFKEGPDNPAARPNMEKLVQWLQLWSIRVSKVHKSTGNEELYVNAIPLEDFQNVIEIVERPGSEIAPDAIHAELQKEGKNVNAGNIPVVLSKYGEVKELFARWRAYVLAKEGPRQDCLYAEATLRAQKLPAPEKQWMGKMVEFEAQLDEDEGITLNWAMPSKQKRDHVLTPIAGYVLFKEWEDRGKPYKKCIDIRNETGDVTSYVDKEREIKIRYSYKICAYVENKDAQGGEKFDVQDVAPHLILSEITEEKLKSDNKTKEDWLKDLVRSNIPQGREIYIESPYTMVLKGIVGNKAWISIQKKTKTGMMEADCRVEEGQPIKAGKVDRGKKIELDPSYTLLKILRRHRFYELEIKDRQLAALEEVLLTLDAATYEPSLDKGEVSKEMRKALEDKGIKFKSKDALIELLPKEPPKEEKEVDENKTEVKSEFWGYIADSGSYCVIPDKRSFVKIKGQAWLLNLEGGRKIYLIEKVDSQLKIADARAGKWVYDEARQTAKANVTSWKVETRNAVIYKDEKDIKEYLKE